ncbi:GNAT family N-acetyltransferase [Nocardioides sp. SLBN-35]|uniref:GNAT family N-acetyltransferase n=1 Tax=Nocardioides sp. SLBN-35 TaxID=2768445 RepID=UPI0011517ABB|nr:N-acetyltransferase [Nocardioides sp. SLBN-35]TQK68366.1 putative acetyltransferase [Nocardioides sp. SLBN-35]
MSFEIRPQRPDDDDATRQLIGAAFGAEGAAVVGVWGDVVARGHDRAQLVAVDATGALVGHVGLSHGWLDTRQALVDVLVLSPLSVAPAHQGRGVGAALLEAAVAEADRLGAPVVVLEGDPGYYSRHGWSPAADLGIEAPTRRVPGPAFQAVPLASYQTWMTGRVVYRDVWWEHDSTGLRDPVLADIEARLG